MPPRSGDRLLDGEITAGGQRTGSDPGFVGVPRTVRQCSATTINTSGARQGRRGGEHCSRTRRMVRYEILTDDTGLSDATIRNTWRTFRVYSSYNSVKIAQHSESRFTILFHYVSYYFLYSFFFPNISRWLQQPAPWRLLPTNTATPTQHNPHLYQWQVITL